MLFVFICNSKFFDIARKTFKQHSIGKDDAIFFLFDSYFKLLTKHISPLEMDQEEKESLIATFESWNYLWKNSQIKDNENIQEISESLVFQ